ncbi:MAG TPA: hypothetical protein VGS21_01165, partial [Acidimicrobiales bacterium]|nr:hypothetical protein [Acidimicrobiales bacterium]
DGSVRYLNHAGGVTVIEPGTLDAASAAGKRWVELGQILAMRIGPWEDEALPTVPAGHARLLVLTPSGPHFGQGPLEALTTDRLAAAFVDAATKLLLLVVNSSTT